MPLSARIPSLDALDLLLTVAATGSIGAAAQEHGVSQPAASARMAAMERLMGVALLDRSPRGSVVTATGSLVVDWARDVVHAAAALEAGVAALREERRGRLRLAASTTVAEYLVPGWLVTYRGTRPEVAVSLRAGNSAEVLDLVRQRRADLGLIESPGRLAHLRSHTVATDELVLVVAARHPWARRRHPVTPAELARTPLVHREAGSGTRDTLLQALEPYGGAPPAALEVSSTTAIKAAVAAGIAPAVLSALAVRAELADGRLRSVPLAGMDLRRPLR
ncbi:MAG: LysR family transcriptional regulator, partial [Dermatophilaceae bacterium]